MNIPRDKDLYEKIKQKVINQYSKNSAYRSGQIVQQYKKEFKKLYGENVEPYIGKREKGNLYRWYKEEWSDVAGLPYPVFRPTKIINKELTPLTVEEIDPLNLIKQSLEKQIIKGEKNLTPFKPKNF
jgi:hypothetical protein